MNAICNEPISNRDPRFVGAMAELETDDARENERDYAAWLESRRAEMEHEFALDRDDAFDEFCRERFEEECL